MEDSANQEAWKLAQSTELSKRISKTTTTTTHGDTTLRVVSEESRVAEQSIAAASRQAEMKQLHVAALDEVVSVNSFFTAAVFIGLSFNAQTTSLVTTCMAGQDVTKQLVIFEVTAFSCFLFSTLIAQGLKLQMTLSTLKFAPPPHHHLLHSDDDEKATPTPPPPPRPRLLRPFAVAAGNHPSAYAHVYRINPNLLRFGMMFSAIGSIAGTIFLMLAMINVIQIRLGLIQCHGSWANRAVYPLVTLVSTGVLTFISPVLYAVITYM